MKLNLTPLFDNVKSFFNKHGAKILAGSGCVGVAATGYFAYRAGKHADNKKFLIPPILIGGATIVAIILSEAINEKTILALTATGTYLAVAREKLEEQIKERYGEEELDSIKKRIKEFFLKEYVPHQTYEETGNGDVLCFEGLSGRVFRSSREAVDRAIDRINERFDGGEYVSLNDFYDELGIVLTMFGNEMGWPNDPDYYDGPICIETEYVENPEQFSNLEDFHEPVYCIDIKTFPMLGWYEI